MVFLAVGRVADAVPLAYDTAIAEPGLQGIVRQLLVAAQTKLTPGHRTTLQWGEGFVSMILDGSGELLFLAVLDKLSFSERKVFLMLYDLQNAMQVEGPEAYKGCAELGLNDMLLPHIMRLHQQYKNVDSSPAPAPAKQNLESDREKRVKFRRAPSLVDHLMCRSQTLHVPFLAVGRVTDGIPLAFDLAKAKRDQLSVLRKLLSAAGTKLEGGQRTTLLWGEDCVSILMDGTGELLLCAFLDKAWFSEQKAYGMLYALQKALPAAVDRPYQEFAELGLNDALLPHMNRLQDEYTEVEEGSVEDVRSLWRWAPLLLGFGALTAAGYLVASRGGMGRLRGLGRVPAEGVTT